MGDLVKAKKQPFPKPIIRLKPSDEDSPGESKGERVSPMDQIKVRFKLPENWRPEHWKWKKDSQPRAVCMINDEEIKFIKTIFVADKAVEIVLALDEYMFRMEEERLKGPDRENLAIAAG